MTRTRVCGTIAAAYCVGIVGGNVLWAPYSHALLFTLMLGGLMIAAPLLAVAVLVGLFFRRSVSAHLGLWCLLAPWLVTAAYAVFEIWAGTPDRYFLNRAIFERLSLALTCAGVASLSFYLVNRQYAVTARADG